MGHAARQDDLDHALGLTLFALVPLLVRPRLMSQEIAERQPQRPDNANAQEFAATRLAEVVRIIAPSDDVRFRQLHGRSFLLWPSSS